MQRTRIQKCIWQNWDAHSPWDPKSDKMDHFIWYQREWESLFDEVLVTSLKQSSARNARYCSRHISRSSSNFAVHARFSPGCQEIAHPASTYSAGGPPPYFTNFALLCENLADAVVWIVWWSHWANVSFAAAKNENWQRRWSLHPRTGVQDVLPCLPHTNIRPMILLFPCGSLPCQKKQRVPCWVSDSSDDECA